MTQTFHTGPSGPHDSLWKVGFNQPLKVGLSFLFIWGDLSNSLGLKLHGVHCLPFVLELPCDAERAAGTSPFIHSLALSLTRAVLVLLSEAAGVGEGDTPGCP